MEKMILVAKLIRAWMSSRTGRTLAQCMDDALETVAHLAHVPASILPIVIPIVEGLIADNTPHAENGGVPVDKPADAVNLALQIVGDSVFEPATEPKTRKPKVKKPAGSESAPTE